MRKPCRVPTIYSRYSSLLLLLRVISAVARHMLVIGDSTDRNVVIEACLHLHGSGSSYGGTDFISRNGRTRSSWDSQDVRRHNSLDIVFPKINTTNWSDLSCWLPQLHMRVSFLFAFGSGEPPYALGMCTRSEEDNGAYCNTTSRISRGVRLLQEKVGTIDTIFFQTVFWDVSLLGRQSFFNPHHFLQNYRDRIIQLHALSPFSFIVLKTSPSEEKYKLHAHAEAFNSQVVRRVWNETKYSSLMLFDWALSARSLSNQSLFSNDFYHLNPKGCLEHFLAMITFEGLTAARLFQGMI